jgi:uncharacterized caspase-like protein
MNKFALLVGIANYENPQYRLRGPLNDVRNFRNALIVAYGFEEKNIAVLTDRDASRNEIMIHLEELLGASCGSGSNPCHLVFYYSGHGTQVPDTGGDEADHLDEAIVPWDFDGSKDSVITDDMIYDCFKKYYREGMVIDFIYDSCFSGGMERAIHHKFIPVDSRYSHLPRATKLVPVPSMVVWTASKENQVSEEQEFSYASMSQMEGVFTHYLVQAIKDYYDVTRSAIIKLIRQKIKNDGFTQRPKLVGSKKLRNLPFKS